MKRLKSIIYFLIGILAIYSYSKVHTTIENFCMGGVPSILKTMLVELLEHEWVARLLVLVFAFYEIVLVKQLKKYETMSWHGTVWIFVALIIVSFSAPRWINYQSGFAGIPLVVMISTFLFFILIAHLCQILQGFEKKIQNGKIIGGGFVPPSENLEIKGLRKEYADQLVDRLVSTDNSKESFAIVIYGSWGAGKTVFLNIMKRLLEDKQSTVIEFNPWKCNSVNQIRTDFLEILRDTLKIYDPSLSHSILKYSDLISTVDTSNALQGFMEVVLSRNRDNLYEIKEKIVSSLQKMRKSVYVLVDDLDRLETNEIFEVLKLIRNTANFPYLKFIVACDKGYVAERLKTKGVEIRYLEKIFMAEFYLPHVYSDFPNTLVLIRDIRKIAKSQQVLGVFDMLSFEKKNLLNKCLGSFRQAKRFAAQIVVAMEFTESFVENKRINVLLSDLLWIELLKFIDYDTYTELKNVPSQFFRIKNKGISKYGLQYYVLKKDEELPKLKENVLQVLRLLFPTSSSSWEPNNRCSIEYLENYDKYFSYGLSPRHITESTFINLLYVDNGLTEIYKQFCQWKKNKLTKSMGNRIMMTNTHGFGLNEAIRFVYLIFLAVDVCKEDFYKQLILAKLLAKCYDENIRASLSKELLAFMEASAGMHLSYVSVASLCHEMYMVNEKNIPTLLTKEQLEGVVRQNFSNYLSTNEVDAADVIDSATELHDVVEKSCIATPILDEDGNLEEVHYHSMIAEQLLAYFSEHKSKDKNAIKEFETLDLDLEDDTMPYDASYAQEKKEEEICSLFGKYENYRKFKEQCFE